MQTVKQFSAGLLLLPFMKLFSWINLDVDYSRELFRKWCPRGCKNTIKRKWKLVSIRLFIAVMRICIILGNPQLQNINRIVRYKLTNVSVRIVNKVIITFLFCGKTLNSEKKMQTLNCKKVRIYIPLIRFFSQNCKFRSLRKIQRNK